MFNKNSIFIKVLVPVIIVTLIQTLLISVVLYVDGTFASIDDGAIGSLRKNVQNRGITLENMMVRNWANLEKLESDTYTEISGYLDSRKISAEKAFGSYEHETGMLYALSDQLLETLRHNSSTGVFIYFVSEGAYHEDTRSYNGIYYRDLDPFSTPADYSDIMYLRGFVDIARRDGIQLDSLWSEVFTFSPEYSEAWHGFSEPLRAAFNNPGLASADLAYWNRPCFFGSGPAEDSNECITYTRPIFWDGRLIAMIGSEIQVEQIKKYFPPNDFDGSGKGGYILLRYNAEQTDNAVIDCDIFAMTGSYIRRLIGQASELRLTLTDRAGVYTIDGGREDAKVVLEPLRLYNSNAPFSAEQWALASICADSMLFETSRSVKNGILFSTILALMIGILLIAIVISISIRPLSAITEQIENSDLSDPIIVTKSNTYEIALLCSTINAMRDRRRLVETELRDERERYLIALESAGDTFMEYDVSRDLFMLYYFHAANQESEIQSRIITEFSEKVRAGEICHEEDIQSLVAFFTRQTSQPVEIRVRASEFSHIGDAEPDGGYYWVLVRAAYLCNEDGGIKKIIGTVRQITDEKRKENALIETTRRDLTTGFYNRDYGLQFIQKKSRIALAEREAFSVCVIHIDTFAALEARYGRVFGGVVLMRFKECIESVKSEDDIVVRLDNNSFLIFFKDAGKIEVRNRIYQIYGGLAQMYAWEAPDLYLKLSVGAVLSTDGEDFYDLYVKAYQAAQYAMKTGGGHLEYYDELAPEAQDEKAVFHDNPISVSLDMSRENIVGLTFDLFERSTDINSVINILLAVLGRTFSLEEILICSFDAAFGADQVAYQWNVGGGAQYKSVIEKISRSDLNGFERLLDENGTMMFDGEDADEFSEGIKRLLCVRDGEEGSVFVCALYESGVHTGRILFKSKEQSRAWTEAETHSFYEVSKIISARISVERSNSASRAKSEFLSRISHEIRTPMNAILGMTEIAKESQDNPERIEDCLNKIDFSAKHLLSLINDVLEMSRIESGKLHIQNEPFSIKEFITAADTLMRPQIEAKGISFAINTRCTHTHVIGDEYRLRQVLVNLLGNAGKFTDSGGKIILSIDEQAEAEDGFAYYRFSVSDNGIGISKNDQTLIFEAFSQAENNTSSRESHKGTGLGLAISSSIINAMGGKIELESEYGAGTEFYFTLKLMLDKNETVDTLENDEETDFKAHLAGKRVLLAEDNEINVEIARYILEKVGIIMDSAKNGLEAVEMFFESKPGYYSVVLMDIQMPVMDGLAATREIRKNSDRADARTIPIVAMTANAFDEDMKKSIESGMDGHIAKPIDNTKFYELLMHLLA